MNKDTVTTILGVLVAAGLGVQGHPDLASPDVQSAGQLVSVVGLAIWGFLTNRKPKV